MAAPLPKAFMFRLAIVACILVALGACAASGSAGDPPAGASGLKVRVLIYSGRPDPTFVIGDGGKISQLKQLLDQATPDAAAGQGDRKTVLPSILGYKGILVENPAGLGGLPHTFAVYRQNVEVRDGGATRFLSHGGALESFLIDEAMQSKTLDAAAIESLRSARGGSEVKP